MGTITRTFTNNIGASGVLGSGAINNASLNSITSISGVSLKLLSTATASNDSSLSFTSNLDSTYDEYWFVFNNVQPAAGQANLNFNGSTDGGSNYNVTKTTTLFQAYHNESDTTANIEYETTYDLAQSTGYQIIFPAIGGGADECCSGILCLYNPSSTTYVKHFISSGNWTATTTTPTMKNSYVAGYGNTTSAVNAVRFQMSSGNIDAGTIYLYGIK